MTVTSDSEPRDAVDRWQTIFDGDRERVVVVGPAGEILAVNRAWRARHGELQAGAPWTERNCFDVLVAFANAETVALARSISEVLDGLRDEFQAELHTALSGPLRHSTVRGYAWVHDAARCAVLRFADVSSR